jgi:hypothetical protein
MPREPRKWSSKRPQRDDESHAYIKGPLFPRRVLRVLQVLFGLCVMLLADWFGLLLLNTDGAIQQLGTLGVLRVTAAFTGGVALTSLLLSAHYKRLHTYDAEEIVFFDLTFAISFLLGGPCALVGVFA